MTNVSKKTKIISDSMALSSVRVIVMASGFVKNIILAKLFVPASYGLLNFVFLILSYNNYAGAGLKAAAMREVPYFIGKRNDEEALAIQNVTITANMLLSITASVIILVTALLGNFDHDMRLTLVVAAVLFSLYTQYTFYEMKATFLKDFKLISRLRLLDVVLKFFIVIIASFLAGIRGAILSLLLIQLIVLFYASKKIHLQFMPNLDKARLVSLGRLGIPLFLGGLAWTMFLTLDGLMIMKFLGRASFGYYSLATLFLSFFYGLTSDTGTIVYRHSQEHYGKTDESFSLRRFIEEPTRLVAFCFPMVIGVIIFFIDLPTRHILPKYMPSAAVIKVLIFAYFFVFLSIFHGSLFTTLNKQIFHFFLRLFFIIILVLIDLFMIKKGFGIQGVALGTTISWVAYSVSTFFLTAKYIIRETESRLTYILKMLWPVLYASLLILICLFIGRHLAGYYRDLLPGSIFVACYMPIVLYINKKTNIFRTIMNIVYKAA